jgi:hypothetical protein
MEARKTCRTCSMAIRWVKLPSGKLMPVDAEPDPRGTVAIHSDGVRAAVLTKEEREDLPPDTPLYLSHFVTCPQAEQHRRGP